MDCSTKIKGTLIKRNYQGTAKRKNEKRLISPRKVDLCRVVVKDGLNEKECKIFSKIPVDILGKHIELKENYQELYDGKKIFYQELYVEEKEFMKKTVVTAF